MTKAQKKAIVQFVKRYNPGTMSRPHSNKVYMLEDIHGYVRPHIVGDYGILVLPEDEELPEGFEYGDPGLGNVRGVISNHYDTMRLSGVFEVDNPKEDIQVPFKSKNTLAIDIKLARTAMALVNKKRLMVSYDPDYEYGGLVFEANNVQVHVLPKVVSRFKK